MKEKHSLLTHKKLDKILRDYGFFSSLAKRDGARITYTYRSISWYAITITITILKTKPNEFGSPRIVIGATMNGETIEDIKDLISRLNNIHKIQNKERVKLFKKAK